MKNVTLGAILLLIVVATTMQATLRVAVEGPDGVLAGQEFKYTIRIVEPPEEDTAVMMYYIPPLRLECIETSGDESFKVGYSPDLRRVYGEGAKVGDDVTIDLTMKACETLADEDAPSYFIFLVCDENGEDVEYYKRKGLRIYAGEEL